MVRDSKILSAARASRDTLSIESADASLRAEITSTLGFGHDESASALIALTLVSGSTSRFTSSGETISHCLEMSPRAITTLARTLASLSSNNDNNSGTEGLALSPISPIAPIAISRILLLLFVAPCSNTAIPARPTTPSASAAMSACLLFKSICFNSGTANSAAGPKNRKARIAR